MRGRKFLLQKFETLVDKNYHTLYTLKLSTKTINMCTFVAYTCGAEKVPLVIEILAKQQMGSFLEHHVYYIHLYSPELSAPHEVKMK